MTTIRRYPTVVSYSAEYQADLMRAKAEVLTALRQASIQLPDLVCVARTAYQVAWSAELERQRC